VRCKATNRDGTPCTLPARDSNGFCWAHDPANADRRSKAASKGGKSRRGGEVAEIKKRIRTLVDEVVEGKVDRGKASVAFQGLGVLKGFLELERKIRETEEIEARLAELEQAAGSALASGGARGPARRWPR